MRSRKSRNEVGKRRASPRTGSRPEERRSREVAREYETAVARVVLAAAEQLGGVSKSGVELRQLRNFLRGNQNPPADLTERSTLDLYGLLAAFEAIWIDELVTNLVDSGELEATAATAHRVQVSRGGQAILRESAAGLLKVLPRAPRLGANPALEKKIWNLRQRLAAKEGRAPYGIFPNAVLAAIVAERPQSLGELATIRGLGEARIRKYGRAILRVVKTG